MYLKTLLKHRRSVAVLIYVQPKLAQQLASLGRLLDTQAGSRGAMLLANAAGAGADQPPHLRYYPELGVVYAAVSGTFFDELRRFKGVRSVHVATNLGRVDVLAGEGNATAVVPPQGPTKAIELMKVTELWKQGLDGTGIKVAQIDSGVDGTHPALKGAISDVVWVNEQGQLQNVEKASNCDEDGHGTHTAATLAGRTVTGVQVGVAPGARLLVAKLSKQGDTVEQYLASLQWALQSGAKILNLSNGISGYDPSYLPLIRQIRAKGCLPIAAVGNESEGHSISPGNYEECLCVGACDLNNKVAFFSGSEIMQGGASYNVPDLVAPGVKVVSAQAGSTGFSTRDGTSMATPHVAGLAALLWQAKPTATLVDLEQAILKSANPGMNPDGRVGAGLPDAELALNYLKGH